MAFVKYKGSAIMYNPITERYYFYSGTYSNSKLHKFKSLELARKAIDDGKAVIVEAKS